MELATSLVEGRMDASNYEDDVRALLGELLGQGPACPPGLAAPAGLPPCAPS